MKMCRTIQGGTCYVMVLQICHFVFVREQGSLHKHSHTHVIKAPACCVFVGDSWPGATIRVPVPTASVSLCSCAGGHTNIWHLSDLNQWAMNSPRTSGWGSPILNHQGREYIGDQRSQKHRFPASFLNFVKVWWKEKGSVTAMEEEARLLTGGNREKHLEVGFFVVVVTDFWFFFYLVNRSRATSPILIIKAYMYETLKVFLDVRNSLRSKEALGLSFKLSGPHFFCIHFNLSIYLQLVGG